MYNENLIKNRVLMRRSPANTPWSMRLNIPYFEQATDYTCGPAVVAMVLSSFGHHASEEDLAHIAGTRHSDDGGTTHEGMMRAVRSKGFHGREQERNTIAEIESYLSKGFPVIIDYVEPIEEVEHYALVIGHEGDMFIFHDPSNGAEFKISKKEFESRWYNPLPDHQCSRWMMVVSDRAFSSRRPSKDFFKKLFSVVLPNR